MDTDHSSNKDPKGRFGSDDDLKTLYHDYLTQDDNSVLSHTYSGTFKPKTLKKKVSSSLGLTPEKDLALPSAEATALDWNHLRIFYYVAKAGGFTKAETYLYVTQSAISRSIQHLEKHLGERLFLRAGNKLILTRRGTAILAGVSQCISFFESLSNASQTQKDIALQIDQEAIGFLRPYLPTFINRYPEINLQIKTLRHISETDLQQVDVTISPPIDNRPDLIQIPLISSPVKLYASQTYFSKITLPTRVSDLKNHCLIKCFGEEEDSTLFITADTLEDRLALAVAGIGIVAVPEHHPALKHGHLIELPNLISFPDVQYHYIYSAKHQHTPSIQLLQTYLTRCFES